MSVDTFYTTLQNRTLQDFKRLCGVSHEPFALLLQVLKARLPPRAKQGSSSGKKKRPPNAQGGTDPVTAPILATTFCKGNQADFALFKARRTALGATAVCLADHSGPGLDKIRPNARTPQKKSKPHPLTDAPKGSNRAIARQRIGCDPTLARWNGFKFVAHPYRNRRRFGLWFPLHRLIAICNLERAK